MTANWWAEERGAGVLLHITSLPGAEANGTLGQGAYDFVDFLATAGQKVWQILPLGQPGSGNSPYSALSAFAGNPALIDLAELVASGDLEPALAEGFYPKDELLAHAARNFLNGDFDVRRADFAWFCASRNWLDDFALFSALREQFVNTPWQNWPCGLRRRQSDELAAWSEQLAEQVRVYKYCQWQFDCQWQKLHNYATSRGIKIFGDLPLFVSLDSCDVWCRQHEFKLDMEGWPIVVAGVPPDCFAENGQLWGNPHYDWQNMGDFWWWRQRVENELSRCDLLRIDHFRGLESSWEVPVGCQSARDGWWATGPGMDLFTALRAARDFLPLVAEDLGFITPEVEELRRTAALPGMRILQFAFDSGPDNPYLPQNHTIDSVVYTGTHDNDTSRGWYDSLAKDLQERVCHELGCQPADVVSALIRAAYRSPGFLAIIPLQDLLNMGNEARMNVPGVADGNWGWRAPADYADRINRPELKLLAKSYGR